MAPEKILPYPEGHKDEDAYVDALLHFLTSSELLQMLCGGVHILDFMTSEPDLYSSVLPADWRHWLESVDIQEFLDLLMRSNLSLNADGVSYAVDSKLGDAGEDKWHSNERRPPPPSLLEYIATVRHLSLDRSYSPPAHETSNGVYKELSRHLAVGMKPKKAHEVQNFAAFVDDLASEFTGSSGRPISHLVDFGSGQNYLGRVLASPLYSRQVIAVERKHLNIDGAKSMDVTAKLAKKHGIWRNKKAFRATGVDSVVGNMPAKLSRQAAELNNDGDTSIASNDIESPALGAANGKLLYVEHEIMDGKLDMVMEKLSTGIASGEVVNANDSNKKVTNETKLGNQDLQIMCISLHSCGNLSHHGIRSLVLNPFVKVVALVGCCYNLVTERLGPPTYKLPILRPRNERAENIASRIDPHGFPMSEKMTAARHEYGSGVRLNITARMMAVQAPQNWTPIECDSFFTRHFFRALLQRVFVDRGFAPRPEPGNRGAAVSPCGWSGGGAPIILGSFRKSCYTSFVAYVGGALEKLAQDPERASALKACMDGLTDEELVGYEVRFANKKHQLCVLWSLMAFSAGVVESAIVIDRWLYLKEQAEVNECWVQTVFDYRQSPRNLVVVGVKK